MSPLAAFEERSPSHAVTEARRTTGGPGTELKKLLSRIGIAPSANCKCNRRAQTMDARGPDWCEQNLDLIVSWLREEAERRKLPFADFAGTILVRQAIRRARRNAAT